MSDTFDFGNANENQKMAISTTDGAVLIKKKILLNLNEMYKRKLCFYIS